jgi:hypothetical protein
MTEEKYKVDKSASVPWDATKFNNDLNTAFVVNVTSGAPIYSFMNADINSIPDSQGWKI